MTKNSKQPGSQRAALWNREHGFTLLELIVAITILSLVTVLIGSGFRLALDSWDKGEAETQWTQRMRVLSGQLSQQIKSAYPYKMKIDDKPVMVFEGRNDSIMFATAFSDSSSGGFKWVRYSFRDETLFYKEGLLPDKKMDDKISGDEDIMDPDVQEVKFEYLSL
ncbi:MAG: prepilin-type N-terminal cleavage/methylation domain-containing protein, partial [Nitrospirota bacterium]|nr:prepilin-type N-terminal cleavage/methylation domain-containing protein [Nitrospirota bacterium]